MSGQEAADVWAESFRKLGLESTDFKDFDSDFYEKVKSTVENLNQESKNSNFNNLQIDSEITLEEVESAIKKLKKGKAVGVDGIFNEVFKFGGDQTTIYLWKLFQKIFASEAFPEQWSKGLIFPLFKGGGNDARMDTGKYRGITLLSILGKTYTIILNERLSRWVEQNKILWDGQAGFRRENLQLINCLS